MDAGMAAVLGAIAGAAVAGGGSLVVELLTCSP